MKRYRQILVLVVATIAANVLASGIASATTGAWAAYPGQQTTYASQIKQPINSDGSSVFTNDSTSVIPVKFALASGLGPFVFESIYSDGIDSNPGTTNDYSFLSFTPASALTFNEISVLKAHYTFTLGDCHGGSLRWSVRTSPTQSVFIYYGAVPAFGNGGLNGCTPSSMAGVDQSGVNMIGQSDLRYDTSQYPGGTFYDSYAHAQALVGSTPVIRASLVLDSGWGGDQRLTLGSATVNNNTFTPPSATTLKSTCALPPADIKVTKESGTPPLGVVNEPVSIQPADTNGHFRIVDCKYMYNLAVSSLSGTGEYNVEVVINDNTVPPGAEFSLK
jgi:hypothetical protein